MKEPPSQDILLAVIQPVERAGTHPCPPGELLVGRPDPGHPGHAPDIDLGQDLEVSRSHARVCIKGSGWTIEDLGSRFGTRVEGREIKGRGAVELLPGMLVRTGNTTWMIMPAHWILVRRESVILYGSCTSSFSYASLHCGMPVLGSLAARNLGRERSPSLKLGFEMAGFSDHEEVMIPPMDPLQSLRLAPPAIRFHVEKLWNVTEPVRTRLAVTVDDTSDPSAGRDLVLLGFWDWPLAPGAGKNLAAFVSPRNPMVERLVGRAREGLRIFSGRDSFGEILRSGQPDAEVLIARSLYWTLAERHRLHWLSPETREAVGSGTVYQTIRPPHRIFPRGLDHEGQGTCLDLSLLFAACMENIGLCPVVVLLGDEEGVPRHALPGCWVGTVPGNRPVNASLEELQKEIRSGLLVLVEGTGLAVGAGERFDFDRAVTCARERVSEARWGCLVDIKALRPPFGSITPMVSPMEPEVGRAFDEARLLAESKHREYIETIHLFHGLLAAKGALVLDLLGEMKIEPDEALQRIEHMVKSRSSTGEPSPTRTHHECRRLAEDIAWQAGAPSVREQDLLWALLIKGRQSAKLLQICAAAGLDLDRMARLLEKVHPSPESLLSSFSYTARSKG